MLTRSTYDVVTMIFNDAYNSCYRYADVGDSDRCREGSSSWLCSSSELLIVHCRLGVSWMSLPSVSSWEWLKNSPNSFLNEHLGPCVRLDELAHERACCLVVTRVRVTFWKQEVGWVWHHHLVLSYIWWFSNLLDSGTNIKQCAVSWKVRCVDG